MEQIQKLYCRTGSGILELQEFDDLKKIIGQTKAMPKPNQVDINNQGLTDEQYEELESLSYRRLSFSQHRSPGCRRHEKTVT